MRRITLSDGDVFRQLFPLIQENLRWGWVFVAISRRSFPVLCCSSKVSLLVLTRQQHLSQPLICQISEREGSVSLRDGLAIIRGNKRSTSLSKLPIVHMARVKVGARYNSSDKASDNLSCSISVEVDRTLLHFLVGRGGSTKAKLEKENGVKLSIPSNKEARTHSSVVIEGSKASIEAASSAIRRILDDAVQSKLQYTHFISLPLLHPTLSKQIKDFQRNILASGQSSSHDPECSSQTNCFNCCSDPATNTSDEEDLDSSGICESIFIKPATFHLTVLMLKLWNEERVETASNVLQNAMPSVYEALEGHRVALDLQGVQCLRGTPDKAHVLYAGIVDSKSKARLLQACQVLTDAFVESGLVMEKDIGRALTLHATLMNTAYRKPPKKKSSLKRVPIDAREILATYGDWNWGKHVILEAHLSERFAYDTNGYYHCVSSIPFPQRL